MRAYCPAEIPPLTQAQIETADSCRQGDGWRTVTWLPTDDQPGVVHFEMERGTPGFISLDKGLAHDVLRVAAAYDSNPGMRGLLERLGIMAWTDRSDLNTRRLLGTFPSVTALAGRIATLNTTLPEVHRIPEVAPFEGGEFSAREFLGELAATGKFLLATGAYRTRDAALANTHSAVHDMFGHENTMSRTVECVLAPLREDVKQELNARLPMPGSMDAPAITKRMGIADRQISYAGLGRGFTDPNSNKPADYRKPLLALLGDRHDRQISELGCAMSEHVKFLAQRFPSAPETASELHTLAIARLRATETSELVSA